MDRIDINLTLCKGSCDINEKPGTVIAEYFDLCQIKTGIAGFFIMLSLRIDETFSLHV